MHPSHEMSRYIILGSQQWRKISLASISGNGLKLNFHKYVYNQRRAADSAIHRGFYAYWVVPKVDKSGENAPSLCFVQWINFSLLKTFSLLNQVSSSQTSSLCEQTLSTRCGQLKSYLLSYFKNRTPKDSSSRVSEKQTTSSYSGDCNNHFTVTSPDRVLKTKTNLCNFTSFY